MAGIGTNPAGAASAYAQAAARLIEGASGGVEAGGAAPPPGPSFASMVQDTISGVVDSGRAAETVSLNAVSGKVDVVDLVTAVNSAEMTLQTVVAVRDRVVQAYQEIMRMPI